MIHYIVINNSVLLFSKPVYLAQLISILQTSYTAMPGNSQIIHAINYLFICLAYIFRAFKILKIFNNPTIF